MSDWHCTPQCVVGVVTCVLHLRLCVTCHRCRDLGWLLAGSKEGSSLTGGTHTCGCTLQQHPTNPTATPSKPYSTCGCTLQQQQQLQQQLVAGAAGTATVCQLSTAAYMCVCVCEFARARARVCSEWRCSMMPRTLPAHLIRHTQVVLQHMYGTSWIGACHVMSCHVTSCRLCPYSRCIMHVLHVHVRHKRRNDGRAAEGMMLRARHSHAVA